MAGDEGMDVVRWQDLAGFQFWKPDSDTVAIEPAEIIPSAILAV
jgi:hypothetical protein